MFKQFGAVTLMSLQTLSQRIGASSVIVIGIAGVVAVLVDPAKAGAAEKAASKMKIAAAVLTAELMNGFNSAFKSSPDCSDSP